MTFNKFCYYFNYYSLLLALGLIVIYGGVYLLPPKIYPWVVYPIALSLGLFYRRFVWPIFDRLFGIDKDAPTDK
jgi:hypothetical protein